MSSANKQPFINSRAFVKEAKTYVAFPSQADAMLASLQLFHDVPCRIMDLFFSIVTHPEFDANQVTLHNSTDVIDVVEESRLRDRMAVIHERTLGEDEHIEQAGFPQFVLEEALDIIHADRLDTIKARFEDTLDMYYNSMRIEEDNILKAMSLVHRSWTIPAQKALGRILHIGRPSDEMDVLLDPVRKSIFGPWTSVVAIQLFRPIEKRRRSLCISCDDPASYCYDCSEWRDFSECAAQDEYMYVDGHNTEESIQWLENIHRIVVTFTHIKCYFLKSYAGFLTDWSNHTTREVVRRNMHLEEIIMYAATSDKAFDLSPLLEGEQAEHLRTFKIQGACLSKGAIEKAIHGAGFSRLNNLTVKRFFDNIQDDLRLFSVISTQSNLRLESLCIVDGRGREESFEVDIARVVNPTQCAVIFRHLCTLRIDSEEAASQWFKWIIPHCSGLKSLTINDCAGRRESFQEIKELEFMPLQSTEIFEHLCTLHIDGKQSAEQWLNLIGPYCPGLESLSIIDFYASPQSNLQASILFNQLRSLRIDSNVAADAWLKLIDPHCSTLKAVTLNTQVALPPTMLYLIPTTIQSLETRLLTTLAFGRDFMDWMETGGDITKWLELLLEILPSKHFPELKSFTIGLSRDYAEELYKHITDHDVSISSRDKYWKESRILSEKMNRFTEEMRNACKDAGVACNISIE